MFSRAPYVAVVVACACTSSSAVHFDGYFTRTELHVDPNQPDALAAPTITLDMSVGDATHTVEVYYARLITDAGDVQLELGFHTPQLDVPGGVQAVVAIENRGTPNRDLVPYCQSVVPFDVTISTSDVPGPSFVPGTPLPVFCP